MSTTEVDPGGVSEHREGMLPIVERPYSRPDTAPAFSTDGSASRIANGLTMPSSVTGTAKSASAAKKEPTAAPSDAVSSC